MIISDICNTLADINGALNTTHGVPRGIYPAPLPENFWTSKDGLLVFQKAVPIPGTVEALTKLAITFGSLAYVTCRPKKSALVTKSWLKTHGFPDAPIYFCKDAWEKLSVAQRLFTILALEDDPKVVRLYSRSGITVLIPDWPYNQDLDVTNAVRIKGVVEDGYG